MGITADQLSVLASEHADEEALAFEEPIHDYIQPVDHRLKRQRNTMAAIKEASHLTT